MPDVIQAKAGIICCCGEEIAEGTVARLATLKALHDLRPTKTVTLCLPLFVARDEEDREFARRHPTITVDGCALRCAARATEMYSGKTAASVVVNEVVAEAGLARPEGRRALNEEGRQAVDLVAERIAQLVDEVLDERALKRGPASSPVSAGEHAGPIVCSCRSERKPTP